MKINIGILGCAEIARKNIRAIKLSKHCRLIAIASRSIEKARAFSKENDLDEDTVKIYGNYDDLLMDNDVDAIYLPLPTSEHLHWSIKVANAYKHILLEKPCALSSEDLITII